MKLDDALQWATKTSCGCNAQEYAQLYAWAMACPEGSSILEIGSWLGASTLMLAAAAQERGARVWSVDPLGISGLEYQDIYSSAFAGQIAMSSERLVSPVQDLPAELMKYAPYVLNNERLLRAGLRRHVTQIIGSSEDLGGRVAFHDLSFVWIDGAHAHPWAKREWFWFAPQVVHGGVVGIHDAQDMAEAGRCINEIQSEGGFKGWTEIDLPSAVDWHGQAISTDGVDCKAPWRTRAWTKTS